MNIPSEQRTWVEINCSALRYNVQAVRARIGPKPGIVGVVKANGYGHGMREVAEAIHGNVELFAVANVEEASGLTDLGRDVLILSPSLPAERKDVMELGCIATVSSSKEAAAYGRGRINFKVDTGMGRIGCWHEQAREELSRIVSLGNVEVHSISTHLPASDEDAEFTRDQLERFAELVQDFKAIAPRAKIHVLNSAGIMQFPDHAYDLVRPGLAIYGCAYPPAFQPTLKPALAWKSRVVLVRDVGAGHSVSYGRTFITPHPMRIASLAVGYADGFPRQVSGRGAQVLVGGKRCSVLGRVTMDQILVDVSEVPSCSPGHEAVLIGSQGKSEIVASELAHYAGTIAWDVFTGLRGRVKRYYF